MFTCIFEGSESNHTNVYELQKSKRIIKCCTSQDTLPKGLNINMYSQIVLPPEESMVDLDDMYGFGALPTTKNVEIELVYQTLWQLLPAKNLTVKYHYNKDLARCL